MTAARPADCKAAPLDDLMVCERCGLSWPTAAEGPPCQPITLERLRRRMLAHVGAAETSLAMVDNLRRKGMAADPAPARRQLIEDNALLRLVDRCASDASIKAILSGKK
ncbi:MAG TPA: hypothetical protein VIH40_13530 [Xanthobacteraceae bacterium]